MKILLLFAAIVLVGCCAFDPFTPSGVDLGGCFMSQPKTCGDFCGGDAYCIKTACHGDPNAEEY